MYNSNKKESGRFLEVLPNPGSQTTVTNHNKRDRRDILIGDLFHIFRLWYGKADSNRKLEQEKQAGESTEVPDVEAQTKS